MITGPNGGGKSSTGLLWGSMPTSARFFCREGDYCFDITERARLGIGYAFQQPPRFKGSLWRTA